MACQASWSADDAWQVVTSAYPYRDLARADFDRCLDYLSGLSSTRQPWLPARLSWTGGRFTLVSAGLARLLRRNLGTILSDEQRLVRLLEPATHSCRHQIPSLLTPAPACKPMPVGSLDEPYADRLHPGDRFLLDGRCLEVKHIQGQEILVEERAGRPAVPRWGSDGLPMSQEMAGRLYLTRIHAVEVLRDGPLALAVFLRDEMGLSRAAALKLVDFFCEQETASEIPDRETCLVEIVVTDYTTEYYVHTPLDRAGNDALARVVVARLGKVRSGTITSIVADLGFMVSVNGRPDLDAACWRSLLALDGFEADLSSALVDSISLRERFHKVALVGLMVLRNPLGGRRKVGGADWAERRLFDQVRRQDPGFVLLRQAEREVREECCDAALAQDFLGQLSAWTIKLRQLAAVSPFARFWSQAVPGPLASPDGLAALLGDWQEIALPKDADDSRPHRLVVNG
jgi:ATP-dependent Lhr-like helicase